MPLSAFVKTQGSFVRLPPTPPDFLNSSDEDADNDSMHIALHVLRTESDALKHLHELYSTDRTVQQRFSQAINTICKSSAREGRIIVSGVGKSGKIGEKFVATLNSLAIRSTFLHPMEAMYGDLGMIGSVSALRSNPVIKFLTCIPRMILLSY